MAVQFSNLPVTLKGISQKSASNLSMPGEMTSADNVQILKGGPNGFEFSKRYGTRALPAATDSLTGITSISAKHLTTLGDALVMDNDQALFVRGVVPDAWLVRDKRGLNWSSKSENVSQSNYQKTFPSHAYDAASGNEIIAWYDQADRVRFSVRQRSTGTWIAHEVVIGTSVAWASNYKCQAFAPGNGYFYVFHPTAVGTQIGVTQISTYLPSVSFTVDTFSLDGTSSPFDVQQTPEGTLNLVARNIGGPTHSVIYWNPTTLVRAAVGILLTTASAAQNIMWMAQDPWPAIGSRVYCLASVDSTNGVQTWKLDPITASVTGPNANDAANPNCNMVGFMVGSSPTVFSDVQVPGYGHGCTIQQAGAVYQRSLTFASRAFRQGGVWYCLMRYDSPVQPTLWLYDLASKRVVGKVGLIGAQWSSLNNVYGQPPWVTQIGNVAVVAAQAAHEGLGQSAATPIGTQIQGIAIASFDGSPSISKPAELGGVLHFPGSIPWIFDGAVCVESGFNLYPEWPIVNPITDSGTGGFAKTIGATYGYRATYSWIDAAGNTYESAPSPIQTYVATTRNDINVKVPTYCLTSRTDVSINLYRDDPQQPTVFKQVNKVAVPNDTTVDYITILDDLADLASSAIGAADWSARTSLYAGDGSNGQPYEHLPPPSCTIMWTAQSRIFVAGVDQDPTAIWVSNEVVPGEGVSYFDALKFRISTPPTAGVGRDRNVVVYTEENIWTVTGEFPDDAGGSFPIPTPFKLPHAVGAINPNAIVVTSLGIFFQSKKGLYILGWDWSANYIGANIEDSLAGQTIAAGLEVPSLNQVRLYTLGGTTCVWDTLFSAWTTFSGQPARSACNWLDQPVYIDANGWGWVETPGIYGDNGAFIPSTAEFSFIAPAGIRGYHSLGAIQLLGEIKGPHQIHASLAYSSQNFPTTSYNFPQAGSSIYGDVTYGTGIYGGAGDNVLKLEIKPVKRQSASFKLKLWDSLLTSGASQGFTLQGFTASVGIEGGLARVQASQRMTKA